MKTILSGFILTFFLVFGCAVATAETQQQQPVSTMQLESVEQRLTHQQALMQKDIDRVQYLYSLELDRIRDIADASDRLSMTLTILLFLGSFLIYFTVSSKAKEEAERAAKHWFAEQEKQYRIQLHKLKEQIRELDARSKEFADKIQADSAHMQQHVEKVKAASDAAETQIADVVQAAQQNLNRSTEEITQLTEAQKQILAQQNQNLREKPEAAYNFEDWRIRAFNAHEQGQLDKAVVFWGNAAEVEHITEDQITKALMNKAITLGKINRLEDEINVYDDFLSRFGSSTTLDTQDRIAKALLNKGIRLGQLERSEDAINAYDDLISRFGTSDGLIMQERVAKSLVNKGLCLNQLKRLEEAVNVYDDLIIYFGTSNAITLQRQVARAQLNKGITLGHLNRSEDAIDVYDDLISRFGKTDEPVLQDLVAKGLVNKGGRLGRLDRLEDTIKICDEIISRFGSSDEVAFQESVAKAFYNKGFALVMDAKTHWENQAQAYQQLSAARSAIQQAIVKSSPDDLAMMRGNLVYVEFLRGQPDQAETHLREALEKGGAKLYRSTLDDIAMHPIPPDKDFKALLERVWQSISS